MPDSAEERIRPLHYVGSWPGGAFLFHFFLADT